MMSEGGNRPWWRNSHNLICGCHFLSPKIDARALREITKMAMAPAFSQNRLRNKTFLFLLSLSICQITSGSETGKVVDIFQQILLLKKPKEAIESHHVVKRLPNTNNIISSSNDNQNVLLGTASSVGSEAEHYHHSTNMEGLPHLLKRLSHAKQKAMATRVAIRKKWGIPDEFEVDIDNGVGFTPGLGDVSVSVSSKAASLGDKSPARIVMIGKFMKLLLSDHAPTFTVVNGCDKQQQQQQQQDHQVFWVFTVFVYANN
jgi:hypothetical protein